MALVTAQSMDTHMATGFDLNLSNHVTFGGNLDHSHIYRFWLQ